MLFSGGSGALYFGFRYIFFHLNVLRPYIKGSFGLQTDSSGQLGSLVELENFRGIGSAGFEHLFLPPFSYRIEAEYSQGSSQSATHVKIGISWGWY